MDHQPFEKMIIENAPRNAAQERLLQEHLQICPSCRKLANGWAAVHTQMRASRHVSPRSGFTNRWQADLASRRIYQQKLQTRRTLLGFGSAAVLLFFVLLGYLAWNAAPIDWLVTLMNAGLRILSNLQHLQQVALTWFSAVPVSIPLTAWILVSTGVVFLVAGWLFTLWRITMQGATTQ